MMLLERNDTHLDIPPGDISKIYAAIGAGSFAGRLITGYVCGLQHVDPIIISAAGSFLAGILTAFLPHRTTQMERIILCSLYGFAMGPIFTLPVKLLSDLFGATQFPKYLGIEQLLRGVSCAIASYLSGWIYDITNSYVWVFTFSAICFMIGGGFWIILYKLKQISIQPSNGE